VQDDTIVAAEELAFATSLCDLLAPSGTTRLEYITAEFQPFSNQHRPDVVLVPRVGGFAGQTVFIEVKLSTKPITDGRRFQNLAEHKEFAAEALETAISRYVYVTSQVVPEFSEAHLRQNNILVCDSVGTASDVIDRLKELGIIP
jgi:hypothetical protein